MKYVFLAAFLWVSWHCQAYPVIKSKWSKPMIKLGEPVDLIVWTEYPARWQVVFPDSSHSFGSFICTGYVYSPTYSFDTLSIDTVRYTLVFFELDSTPVTIVPVTYFPPGDSLVLFTDSMRINLWELLPNPAPDTLQFIAITEAMPVYYAFNWIYWIIGSIAGLLIATAALLMVAPRIIRYYRKKKLQKRFLSFIQEFEQFTAQAKSSLKPEPLEKAYLLWKEMIQEITREPLTAQSGSEIARKQGMESLATVLFDLDVAVYSRKVGVSTPEALRLLREKAYDLLQQKLQELEK